MDSVVSRVFNKRIKKIIALTLAFVMFFTIAVSGLGILSRSTINRTQASSPDWDAALKYLAEKTGYVQDPFPVRIVQYVRTWSEPSALGDFYSLAGVQIAQENFIDALYSIERCLELYDGEGDELLVDLWLKKGCLLVMLGRFEEALSALEMVVEIDGSIPEVYLVQAQIYAELESIELLVKSLEAYLILRPDDEDVKSLLATMLVETEDVERLQTYVETYSEPEPTVESEFLRGLYAIQEGDYESAVELLTLALMLDDGYEGIRYYRGVSRLALQDYEGAAEDFTASIAYGAIVQASYYNRGIAMILSDEYELGLEDVLLASQMDEDPAITEQAEHFLGEVRRAEAEAHLIGFLLKAQAAAEQGDYAAMCESLELYLLEVPEDVEVRTMLAQARFANEEYADAMLQYEMVLAGDRSAANVFLYGLTALQLSDFSLAAEIISEAIALDNSIEGLYYYRGVCRLSLEDYEGAEQDFTESISRGEFVHSCYFNRGISFLMLDIYDKGLEDLKHAESLFEDPEVREQAQELLRELSAAGIR